MYHITVWVLDDGESNRMDIWRGNRYYTRTTSAPVAPSIYMIHWPSSKHNPTVLQLLLITVILEKIVQQSTPFAKQNREKFLFCVEELQAFIGLSIPMSLQKFLQISDYWSTTKVLATPCKVSCRGGGVHWDFHPPQIFFYYEIITTSKATIGYTTQ